MDEALSSLLLRLLEKGVLDHTAVLVFGDHGHRVSALQRTPQGRAENRLPFLAVTLPRSVPSHIRQTLAGNKNVVISWYDVHHLLLDLATFDLENKHIQVSV